ncbi:pyruvate dehydrogenase (acetyl-transferring) E1 component subunit alpha [Actinoalloteichus sp. AHMU CJ021]|uniref:pyruvate dehydrogenase (acetyl-transferring) E1 component subunit alpha n=2 Tax=Pseudonocardiaceae TaxID=2070 RepID=UPI000429B88C|nr:pyruvate dehydrogenase (acetyl-transferring) E1 component subunit alpha [Actinoalloteichus caeruleus]AUS78847.1 pyruvate dehydrogenase (acetyl-transferring) E1 component subunit alpha [Actinoalloteichus sp. AHMU CJ021]
MSSPEYWTKPQPPDAAGPESPSGSPPAATAARPTAEQVIAGLRATSEGGPDLVQLLTPEGERVAHPHFDIDITPDELRGLYRDMVLVRRADRESNALQRQGQLGIWVPLLGQEAAQIGAGRAMRPRDMAFPSYREHGVAWCRGIDPTELLGIFRGTDHGSWDPMATRFHPYTIVIGNQCLNAVGYAMGQRFDGRIGDGHDSADAEATVVFFGDGATSQGDVNEAFVWGAVYDAPVVFFCQNNQWAISEPMERQSRIPLYQRASGYGFPGIRVDGNDVLATLAVTRWALEECRSGNGPVLIEAFTYRMDAHTTSDDPSRYRLADELEAWKLKDPIERVKAYLHRQQWADGDYFAEVERESDALAARLREYCQRMPVPSADRMFSEVYANGSSAVSAQRDEFLTYLSQFEQTGGER